MKPHAYTASDYAGIGSKNIKFYYDYERTQNGENCFEAVFQENGEEKVITIPYSKLGTKADEWNCEECLMQGIAWIFQKYKLCL